MNRMVGHYQILEEIGSGGFATVYRASDTRSGETVALKMLHPQRAAEAEVADRFRREMLVAARLYDRHIVRVLDFGEQDGVPYLVMEYLPESLDRLLRRRAPLPVEEAIDIALQICHALETAHQREVVHRDLKPANVLVAPDGTMKVADFGLAKALDISASVSSGIMGTPYYMSPEQILGRQVDIRTDLYALGVMLYEMLAGHGPFDADTPVAMAQKHVQEPPPPLRSQRPEVPVSLEAVAMKCLAKDPADRFQGPAQMMQALGGEEATRQEPGGVAAVPGGPPPPDEPPFVGPAPASRWWPPVLLGLAVGALIALAMAATFVGLVGLPPDGAGVTSPAFSPASPAGTPGPSPTFTPAVTPRYSPTPTPTPAPLAGTAESPTPSPHPTVQRPPPPPTLTATPVPIPTPQPIPSVAPAPASTPTLTPTPTATPTPVSTGTLEVYSYPTGAKVYLDGEYRGQTLSFNRATVEGLLPDTYTLKVTKSGYKEWSKQVEVAAQKTTVVHAYLEQGSGQATTRPEVITPQSVFGTLEVYSYPTGAKVYLDGEYRGQTLSFNRATVEGLLPDTYTLKVTKSGYKEWSKQVEVAAEKTTVVHAYLEQGSGQATTRPEVITPQSVFGTLEAYSYPTGARVYLNGEHGGQTLSFNRATVEGLLPDTYTLKVTMSGYKEWSKQVEVAAEKTTVVHAYLEQGSGQATTRPEVITPQSVFGTLEAYSYPTGAHVYLNGEYGGQTLSFNRATVEGLLPDTYTLRLALSGYKKWTKQVEIYAGQTSEIHAYLEPAR